jgi:hypothetical protein
MAMAEEAFLAIQSRPPLLLQQPSTLGAAVEAVDRLLVLEAAAALLLARSISIHLPQGLSSLAAGGLIR